MHLNAHLVALGASLLPLASAQAYGAKGPGPDKDGFYWIKSEGLQAGFITYGASLTHMLVNDQYGIPRDVVAGFDNATYYEVDKQHNHFGGVPGRYANRIRNSTFELDGETYHITPNENPTADAPLGADTLHGGKDGWDWRNFTVVSHTDDSITFSIVDPDGKEGFPGEVVSYITYTVTGWTWDFKMVALATTKKTPIMLSSHVYWNLDGFSNNETSTVLNHTFHLPYSGQRVGVDNILIPTGDILANHKGSVNDFWSAPKQIGASFGDPDLKDNCGFNCTGYGKSLTELNQFDLFMVPWSLMIFFGIYYRQLLAREPRPKRTLRLAQRRLRGAPALGVVRHPAGRLLGPGGLPAVLVQRDERVGDAEVDPGPPRQRRIPSYHPPVRLRRYGGRGLDRRH